MAKSFVNQAFTIAVKALLDNNPAAMNTVNEEIKRLDKISAEGDEEDDDAYEAQEVSRNLKEIIGVNTDEYEEEDET